jgi:hypothetical protein
MTQETLVHEASVPAQDAELLAAAPKTAAAFETLRATFSEQAEAIYMQSVADGYRSYRECTEFVWEHKLTRTAREDIASGDRPPAAFTPEPAEAAHGPAADPQVVPIRKVGEEARATAPVAAAEETAETIVAASPEQVDAADSKRQPRLRPIQWLRNGIESLRQRPQIRWAAELLGKTALAYGAVLVSLDGASAALSGARQPGPDLYQMNGSGKAMTAGQLMAAHHGHFPREATPDAGQFQAAMLTHPKEFLVGSAIAIGIPALAITGLAACSFAALRNRRKQNSKIATTKSQPTGNGQLEILSAMLDGPAQSDENVVFDHS